MYVRKGEREDEVIREGIAWIRINGYGCVCVIELIGLNGGRLKEMAYYF